MFDSDRDIPDFVDVPLEYNYIFETDEAGNVVFTDDTQATPKLHQFLLQMERKRAADVDKEEAARTTRAVSGSGFNLPDVEILLRLTTEKTFIEKTSGFDDFPAFTGRKEFESVFLQYFGREKMKVFVNDFLLRHQNIVYPAPFFRRVSYRSVAGDLSRAASQ